MIKVVLIDDEPFGIQNLQSLLQRYYPHLHIAGTARSAIEGKLLIEKIEPDVVFLDVEMPNGNGFDLLDSLEYKNFKVIFVTAFNQYALTAIKHACLDYLLKPIDLSEFHRAIEKIATPESSAKAADKISVLLQQLQQQSGNLSKLALPTLTGITFVKSEDILYCRSQGSYTEFILKDKSKIMVSRSIGEFEESLPENTFMRIHNEYIVNLSYISEYFKGRGGYVLMEDGTTIDVAVRKKKDFLERIAPGLYS